MGRRKRGRRDSRLTYREWLTSRWCTPFVGNAFAGSGFRCSALSTTVDAERPRSTSGLETFWRRRGLLPRHVKPAPVRRYLPELIDLVWNRKIVPGKVFDLELPLEQVAEGYRAMDERRAIKALLRP